MAFLGVPSLLKAQITRRLARTRLRRTSRVGRGFSLIELVIVMMIIGIAAAMALPRFNRAIQSRAAHGAAQRLAADLAMAQSVANTTSTKVTLTFSVGTGRYTITGVKDLRTGATPYAVNLGDRPYFASVSRTELNGVAQSGGTTQLEFNAFGTPTAGGTFTITAGTHTQTVAVDAASGRSQIQ